IDSVARVGRRGGGAVVESAREEMSNGYAHKRVTMRFTSKMIAGAFTMALSLVATIALGYPSDYGPFEGNETPKRFPLRKCCVLEDSNLDGKMFGLRKDGKGIRVRLFSLEN